MTAQEKVFTVLLAMQAGTISPTRASNLIDIIIEGKGEY